MEDELVTFETAKLAKEKGFDIPIFNYYNIDGVAHDGYIHLNIANDGDGYFDIMDNDIQLLNFNENISFGEYECFGVVCSAPTQSFLQRWLREKYNIHVHVRYVVDEDINKYRVNVMLHTGTTEEYCEIYFTYEEALEIGLQEALKLINI